MAMVGAYIGIQFLNNDGGIITDPDNGTSSFKKLSDLQFQEWASVPQWDKTKFDNHISEVKKKFELGNLTEYQHNQLIGNICTYAINKTDSVLCAEWKKPNCKREYIKNQYQGVVEVEKYLKGDARVNKLKGIKKSYDSIYDFIDYTLKHSTFRAKAEVNDDYSWTSFEETAKSIQSRASRYLKLNDYTTYLSNIEYIKFNLSSANIERATKNASIKYYGLIATELINKFNTEWNNAVNDKNSAELDRLTSLMTSTLSKVSYEYNGYQSKSEQIEKYKSFVSQKKAEKLDLQALWKNEQLINGR